MPITTTSDERESLAEGLLNPPDEQDVEEASEPGVENDYSVEYSISSYGADYPVDALVKRIDAGSIYIPVFQRSYVWSIHRASRFIESLLLGLPVPAIFLSKEPDSNRLLVIDGQQRLRTLQYFYNGVFEPTKSVFKLSKIVQSRFQGNTYRTLSDDDRMRLDDSIIHAIVVKQDDPEEHAAGVGQSSVYHIFERLNTGGVLLQPQEIRSCIYPGELIDLLDLLNRNEHWRRLFGEASSRLRDQELILRFFALHEESASYSKPMKEFLNRFAAKHRHLGAEEVSRLSELFQTTIKTIDEAVGDRAFKTTRAVNAAQFDAVTIGVARRLANGPVAMPERLRDQFAHLTANSEFKQAIESGTTSEEKVATRLRLSTEAFRDVP